MSAPELEQLLPPVVHVEGMNPARAQMLAEVAQEEAKNPTPPPAVKIEEDSKVGPLRSGANCSALGNPSLRISRASQQPEGSRGVLISGSAGLSRSQENIKPNATGLSKRPLSTLVKEEQSDREKKPKLSTRPYYTDVQSLGPGESL